MIVDGDEPEESGTFGPSQYTESDVLKESKDKDNGVQSQVATVNSSGDVEVKVESGGQQCDSNVSTSDAEPSSRAQMIEELRNRIRQLEAEGGGVGDGTATTTEPEDYKCLICLVRFVAVRNSIKKITNRILMCFRSITRNRSFRPFVGMYIVKNAGCTLW